MTRLTTTIASVPDREFLVAEVWQGDKQLAELSQEEGRLIVEIYANPSGEPWSFQFSDLLTALHEAKHKLANDTPDQ